MDLGGDGGRPGVFAALRRDWDDSLDLAPEGVDDGRAVGGVLDQDRVAPMPWESLLNPSARGPDLRDASFNPELASAGAAALVGKHDGGVR